ncbi:retrovirus-related pol polyprotein from transposon TNT 1-94 [Tanacetum coccineum]
MLPSIGRVSYTDASRSKPRSTIINARIPRPSHRSKKNKVEAQTRKSKSSSNKNNHVSDCNANIKNVALSKNSANVCLTCNECLFSENHDACVIKYLKDVQICKKAKSVKQKEKFEWKPTGRIFKTVGLKWIPTGRTVNLVRKQCPPSRNMSTIDVPPRQIRTTIVILVDEPCPKLSLRYAKARESLSRSFLNFEIHPFNLHDFGFERILSNEELPPWKFDYLGIVEIVLCYFDSGCSKHMTGHCDKLINFVSKFIEGLGHNLFSVGQFCDSDLEKGSNLYTISMDEMMKSSPICLLSKASKIKSWLWHRRLSYLNFDIINQLARQGLVKGLPKLKYTKDHLCSTCQMGKSKKEPHPHKPEPSTNEKLQVMHIDLCGPMQVESIDKKRYILVIINDYSWFTLVKFLRTKDEAPEIIIKFLKQAQVSLKATVRYLRINNGAEFIN